MTVDDTVPDVNHFDRDDLRLTPKMHRVQAEMAAERGEEYDPYEFEERIGPVKSWEQTLDDMEPVEGKEKEFEEWMSFGDK